MRLPRRPGGDWVRFSWAPPPEAFLPIQRGALRVPIGGEAHHDVSKRRWQTHAAPGAGAARCACRMGELQHTCERAAAERAACVLENERAGRFLNDHASSDKTGRQCTDKFAVHTCSRGPPRKSDQRNQYERALDAPDHLAMITTTHTSSGPQHGKM